MRLVTCQEDMQDSFIDLGSKRICGCVSVQAVVWKANCVSPAVDKFCMAKGMLIPAYEFIEVLDQGQETITIKCNKIKKQSFNNF